MINVIFFYRIARWFFLKKIPLIPNLIRLFIFIIYSSRIPHQSIIGKGTSFTAGGMGVIMHQDTQIGKNCKIGHGAKFMRKFPYKNVPKICDNVFIGSGSVINGAVIIEDNVIVAPNTVVAKSIKKGYIVGGVPAKIIGHIDELDYDVMANEQDKEGYIEFLKDKRKKDII